MGVVVTDDRTSDVSAFAPRHWHGALNEKVKRLLVLVMLSSVRECAARRELGRAVHGRLVEQCNAALCGGESERAGSYILSRMWIMVGTKLPLSLSDVVVRLLDAIDAANATCSTLVLFSSDHGPEQTHAAELGFCRALPQGESLVF